MFFSSVLVFFSFFLSNFSTSERSGLSHILPARRRSSLSGGTRAGKGGDRRGGEAGRAPPGGADKGSPPRGAARPSRRRTIAQGGAGRRPEPLSAPHRPELPSAPTGTRTHPRPPTFGCRSPHPRAPRGAPPSTQPPPPVQPEPAEPRHGAAEAVPPLPGAGRTRCRCRRRSAPSLRRCSGETGARRVGRRLIYPGRRPARAPIGCPPRR